MCCLFPFGDLNETKSCEYTRIYISIHFFSLSQHSRGAGVTLMAWFNFHDINMWWFQTKTTDGFKSSSQNCWKLNNQLLQADRSSSSTPLPQVTSRVTCPSVSSLNKNLTLGHGLYFQTPLTPSLPLSLLIQIIPWEVRRIGYITSILLRWGNLVPGKWYDSTQV